MLYEISDSVRYRRDPFTGRKVDRLQRLINENPRLVLGRTIIFESFFRCYEKGEVVEIDGNWLCIKNGERTIKENIVDVRGIYTLGYDSIRESEKHKENAELIRDSRVRLKKAKDNVVSVRESVQELLKSQGK